MFVDSCAIAVILILGKEGVLVLRVSTMVLVINWRVLDPKWGVRSSWMEEQAPVCYILLYIAILLYCYILLYIAIYCFILEGA